MSNNRNYWMNRMMVTMLSGEKKVKDYERTLKQAYEETKRAISKEVASFYQEYAEEEGISLQAAHKRLKVDELISFNQRSKDYLNEVQAIENRSQPLQAHEAQLKKLSGRAYMTRMDALKANIEHELVMLNHKEDVGMGQTLDTVYDDSYYRGIYDLHKFTKTGVDFAQPGQSQLKAASRYQWNGDNYSSRIWKNKEKLTLTLNQLIPQSFVRGFGSKELAREIADRLEVSYSSAVRLARTEGRYVGNLGTADAYKESGVVTEFMFMATLDDKTSEICQEMDGKVMPLADASPGRLMPPLHPYCRSTTVPYFPDDDIDALIDDRVARNDKGKTYPIGKYQTYKQWAQAKTPAAYAATLLPEDAEVPPIDIKGEPVSPLEERIDQELDFEAYFDTLPDNEQLRGVEPFRTKRDIYNMERWVKEGDAIVGHPNENESAITEVDRLRNRLRQFVEPFKVQNADGFMVTTHPALETAEGVVREAKRIIVKQLRAQYNANHYDSEKADYSPAPEPRGLGIGNKAWVAEKRQKLIDMGKKIRSNFSNGSDMAAMIKRSHGDAGGNCGEDEIMKIMMQGTENAEPPTRISRALYNKMKQKGFIEVHRGVAGKEFKEQFKKGELYYGKGIYGNGTYTALDYSTAYQYGRQDKENVSSMMLHPDARIITYNGVQRSDMLYDIRNQLGSGGLEEQSLGDNGRIALAWGYDAILVESSGYLVVVNRSKLLVPDDE